MVGVSIRIADINSTAVYIHCQLNLVLVSCCKKLQSASEFFSLLENLYVFMSSSIPHSIFMSKQKDLGCAEMQLKKLSDTRWCYRYASIKVIKATVTALLDTREHTSEGSENIAIEARGTAIGIL